MWDLAPETYDVSDAEGNVTFDVDVRLFPDEQQGFSSIPVTIKNDFDRGLEMRGSSAGLVGVRSSQQAAGMGDRKGDGV